MMTRMKKRNWRKAITDFLNESKRRKDFKDSLYDLKYGEKNE